MRKAVRDSIAGTGLTGHDVRLKALSVVDVDDRYLLVLKDIGGIQQLLVDCQRSDVVQIARGHRGPMDL